MAAILQRIALRGSNGVLLKARDEPEVREAVGRLAAAGGAGGDPGDRPAGPHAKRRGVCRHGQPGRGRDRGLPDQRVARRPAWARTGQASSSASAAIAFAARGERETGFRRGARQAGAVSRYCRDHRRTRRRRCHLRTCARGPRQASGNSRGLFDRRRAMQPWFPHSRRPGGAAGFFIGHDLDADNVGPAARRQDQCRAASRPASGHAYCLPAHHACARCPAAGAGYATVSRADRDAGQSAGFDLATAGLAQARRRRQQACS